MTKPITHDYFGLSERDVELARQISAAEWWTLADAEGNEAAVATTMGRD